MAWLAALALALAAGCGEPEPATPAAGDAPREAAVEGPAAVTGAPAGERVSLVVEVRPGQDAEDVAAAAAFLAEVQVSRLFPEVDDPDLASLYVVDAVVPAGVEERGWDLAYRLEREGGFLRVEPNRSDTLVPETERREAAQLCDLEGDPEDPDHAWALRRIHADGAWGLELPEGGKRFGEDVRVCHPDTGWTEHVDLDGLDLDAAWNVMDDGPDAEDPLESGATRSPGHGTATGSVIASDGGVAEGDTTGPGGVTGVAPAATLVPLRSVKHVVQVLDTDVAKAVVRSVESDCDVISMSLGGRGFFGLERAVRYATGQGVIVVAAAGNCVKNVVAPAVYEDTIAVAATDEEDLPWRHSSHGPAVTVSAPGENVWVASRRTPADPNDQVRPSNGTSFATAEVAGAAALWMAHHGRDAIEAAAAGERVQDRFERLLRASARPPEGWDKREYGEGILDVRALLEADLATPAPPAAPPADANRNVVLLARTTGRSPADLREALRVMLGDPPDLDAQLDRWGPELLELALRDPEGFDRAIDAALRPAAEPTDPRPRAAARAQLSGVASESLRAALR